MENILSHNGNKYFIKIAVIKDINYNKIIRGLRTIIRNNISYHVSLRFEKNEDFDNNTYYFHVKNKDLKFVKNISCNVCNKKNVKTIVTIDNINNHVKIIFVTNFKRKTNG